MTFIKKMAECKNGEKTPLAGPKKGTGDGRVRIGKRRVVFKPNSPIMPSQPAYKMPYSAEV